MSRGAKPRRRSGPERILIVDGYNVLNARRHLEGAAALADAREKLLAELQDYAGYSGQKVILVFDAWQGDRQTRSVEEYGPVQVVFTRKGEIADHYIRPRAQLGKRGLTAIGGDHQVACLRRPAF